MAPYTPPIHPSRARPKLTSTSTSTSLSTSPSTITSKAKVSKPSKKRKRPRLPSASNLSSQSTPPSTGALRTAIRNISRLLKREGLPADVRRDKEREIAAYRVQLEEVVGAGGKEGVGRGAGGEIEGKGREGRGKEERRKEERTGLRKSAKVNALIRRYHRVRFFERQKATRRLRKLRRELRAVDAAAGGEEGETQDSEDEQEEQDKPIPHRDTSTYDDAGKEALATILREKIAEAEIDLNYTLYSPLTEKYISLFVEGEYDDDSPNAVQTRREEKPRWWFVVEKAMGAGRLEEVRDGRWDGGDEDEDEVPEEGGEMMDLDENEGASGKSVQDDQKQSKGRGKSKEVESKGTKVERKGKGIEPRDARKGKRIEGKAPATVVEDDEDDSDRGFFEE